MTDLASCTGSRDALPAGVGGLTPDRVRDRFAQWPVIASVQSRTMCNSRAFIVAGLVAVLAFLVGCPADPDFIECRDDTSCYEGGRCVVNAATGHQFCTYADAECPSGWRWSDLDVEDSISGECVAEVVDGGIDAPEVDAMIDADPADAGPDASTPCIATAPPVTDGQAADLVLGQATFTTETANTPFEGAATMDGPWEVFTDGARLWVGDSGNARVLQWNSLPIANAQAANYVVGQTSLGSHTDGLTQTLLGTGSGFLFVVDTKLLVADTANNRVLIWNTIPTTNGEPADLVLGQTSFTTGTSGNGASNLYGPSGIWSDGTTLLVADAFNHRVLIWTTFPTVNGEAADRVLGWSDFGMGGPAISPPTSSSLRNPRGLFFDGTHLLVADSVNNRVLVWNGMPTANNEAADVVIGQGGFDNSAANAGSAQVSAVGLSSPHSVTVSCGVLYIADSINDRVVVHTSVPTVNGEPGDAVLGKPNFTTAPSAGEATTATTLDNTKGVAVAGDKLFVSASGHNRVVRYQLSLPQ